RSRPGRAQPLSRWIMMSPHAFLRRSFALVVGCLLLGCLGCAGRPSLLPNSDPALQKTATQFASDAARRHYEASAPNAGEADGMARVDYTFDAIRLVNNSAEDWNDVEIWVNRTYCVFLPRVEAKSPALKKLDFQMF